jgi:hypothetical protein
MDEIGLDGRRVQMINLSSAMGGQFAISATEFTDEIIQMGPNPLKGVLPSQNAEKQDVGADEKMTDITNKTG